MLKRSLFAVALAAGIQINGATAQEAPTAQYGPRPITDIGVFFQAARVAPTRTPQERQLQEFWSNYYRTLAKYYASLENVDWVAYYQKNGYPIDPRFYNPQGQVPGQMTLVPVHPGVMPPHAQAATATVRPSAQPTGALQQVSWWQFWKKDAAPTAAMAEQNAPGHASVRSSEEPNIMPVSAEYRTPLLPTPAANCPTGNCPIEAATPKRN